MSIQKTIFDFEMFFKFYQLKGNTFSHDAHVLAAACAYAVLLIIMLFIIFILVRLELLCTVCI
jgi:hypothetical protein